MPLVEGTDEWFDAPTAAALPPARPGRASASDVPAQPGLGAGIGPDEFGAEAPRPGPRPRRGTSALSHWLEMPFTLLQPPPAVRACPGRLLPTGRASHGHLVRHPSDDADREMAWHPTSAFAGGDAPRPGAARFDLDPDPLDDARQLGHIPAQAVRGFYPPIAGRSAAAEPPETDPAGPQPDAAANLPGPRPTPGRAVQGDHCEVTRHGDWGLQALAMPARRNRPGRAAGEQQAAPPPDAIELLAVVFPNAVSPRVVVAAPGRAQESLAPEGDPPEPIQAAGGLRPGPRPARGSQSLDASPEPLGPLEEHRAALDGLAARPGPRPTGRPAALSDPNFVAANLDAIASVEAVAGMASPARVRHPRGDGAASGEDLFPFGDAVPDVSFVRVPPVLPRAQSVGSEPAWHATVSIIVPGPYGVVAGEVYCAGAVDGQAGEA